MSSSVDPLQPPNGPPFQHPTLPNQPASSAPGSSSFEAYGASTYDAAFLPSQEGTVDLSSGAHIEPSSPVSGNGDHSSPEPQDPTMVNKDRQNSSSANIRAADDQPPSETASLSSTADSACSSMMHGSAVSPQLYKILLQKLGKWKHRSRADHKRAQGPPQKFENFSLLERLPFYLSLGLLALALLQFLHLWQREWHTPRPIKAAVELSSVFLSGYFIIQALLSRRRVFSPAIAISALVPLILMILVLLHGYRVMRALILGLDLTLISIIFHSLWILIVRLNYLNYTNSEASQASSSDEPESHNAFGDARASTLDSDSTSPSRTHASATGPNASEMDNMVRHKAESWAKKAMKCPIHPHQGESLTPYAISPTALPLYLTLGSIVFHLIQACYLYSLLEFDSTISPHSTMVFLVYFVVQAWFCSVENYPKALMVAAIVPIVLSVLHTVLFGAHSINFFATSLATVVLQSLLLYNVRELIKMRSYCSNTLCPGYLAGNQLEKVETSKPASALRHGNAILLSADLDKIVLNKLDHLIARSMHNYSMARAFDRSPLLERIPYYLNVGILVCYLLEFLLVGLTSSMGFSPFRSTILGTQIVILGPYFVVQARLSARLTFPNRLLHSGVLALFLSLVASIGTFFPTAEQVPVLETIQLGGSLLFITILFQSTWIYVFRRIRFERDENPTQSLGASSLGEKGRVEIEPDLTLADLYTDAKLNALLEKKVQKWTFGARFKTPPVENDGNTTQKRALNFAEASLLERLPFYLSAAILVFHIPVIVWLSFIIFHALANFEDIAVAIFLIALPFAIGIASLFTYYVWQALQSYRLNFDGLGSGNGPWTTTIFLLICSLATGPGILFGGDFMLMTVGMQKAWIWALELNRKNRKGLQ